MACEDTNGKNKSVRHCENDRALFFVGYNQHSITLKFGKSLHDLRKKRGMTQTELAIKSGMNRSYISEVENGKVNISLERAELLSQILGCRLIDLLICD